MPKTYKILIVDDRSVDRRLMRKMLESRGYKVREAADGQQALETARLHKPDLIISDALMPVMDGFQLCRKVKGDKDLNHILFVFYTAAYTEEKDEELALKMGADKFIRKPAEPDEFIKIVQSVIGDMGKGKGKPRKTDLGEEKEVFKLYNERLIKQLEKKMLDLEKEITEHKRAEEALRESEKKYRRIFENIQDVYYESSLDGIILEISPSIENVSQYKRKELIGRSLYDIYTNPEERDEFVKFILDKGKVNDFKISLTDKDGSQHPCSVTALLVKDEQGNPIKFIGSMHDISERKQAEEERKKLEAQLRQAQKMEAVGTLAGGVAHDFNNLLTVIIGNAQLALMDVVKDESLRKKIEEIEKSGDKAASLTRQLLAFSRKQVIKPEVLDFNELLTGIEKMLARLIGEDVELLMIPEPALWQVEVDPGQMEQVIMNLAINARDAMPRGGKLTIETANMDLDESYFYEHGIKNEPGPYVILAVSDTGSGMDKETQKHIFEPFFTTKEVGKGTGLGLSTVYGIVKQNNGFVWVYSEPGQGSTFKVYLPKAEGDADSEEKQRLPVIELGGSETVLIVEDDDGLRKFAQNALQQHGYRVLDAENGEDALKVGKAHEGPIHLMITDVVMPRMGGKEAAERLQSLY
ncbi:MAG: response regulator, partial [Desulfobacterales bacterium]|nr:response regulator [Desulfobacterales bacterium]